MSGGSFDYAYFKVFEFSDELQRLLHSPEEMGYIKSEEVKEKLLWIQIESKKMAAHMKDVEWLFSGDDGEDTFLKNWESIRGESE